jgi:DNA-binding beta-propeller fold protein YncE
MRTTPLLLAGAIVAACGSSSSPPPPDDTDPETFAEAPDSCAYICPLADCAEQTTSYACPSMRAWDKIPHADACPKWDGKPPEVKQGQCTASAPTGDAAKYAGPDGAVHILPDGRRIKPSGVEWIFAEPELTGGLTTAALGVPGTSFVLTVDTGPGDHAVRVVDASKIDTGANPVTSYVPFKSPATLNSGLAFIPPNRVFVSTNDGVVQAMTLDTTTGMIANDDAHSIALPSSKDPTGKAIPWYVSGVAASPDKKLLVVTPVAEQTLFVFDPATGQKLGELALPAAETFGAWFDDADSAHVYVSMWSKKQVLDVDVSNPASPKIARTLATDKDPQQIAFLDARWMVVANDLGDTVSVIDRTSGAVRSVPIDAISAQPLHGSEPSTLAYDAPHKRLYVTLSGLNAVAAYDVDLGQTPPTLTPAGRIATAWWPSGVVPLADGALVITSMRGHGSGPRAFDFAIGDSDISDRMRGSVQKVSAQVAAQPPDDALVDANDAVAQLDGRARRDVPAGRGRLPRAGHERAGAVEADRSRLLHRAREQGLRRPDGRHARGRGARRSDAEEDRGDGQDLAEPPRAREDVRPLGQLLQRRRVLDPGAQLDDVRPRDRLRRAHMGGQRLGARRALLAAGRDRRGRQAGRGLALRLARQERRSLRHPRRGGRSAGEAQSGPPGDRREVPGRAGPEHPLQRSPEDLLRGRAGARAL